MNEKSNIIPSYEEMKLSNGERDFDVSNYLYFAYNNFASGKDVINCMIELFFPKFEIVDGIILITTIGGVHKYQKEIQKGVSANKAQYWANMLVISDMFVFPNMDYCLFISEHIAKCWEATIQKQVKEAKIKIQLFHDKKEQETAITLTNVP